MNKHKHAKEKNNCWEHAKLHQNLFGLCHNPYIFFLTLFVCLPSVPLIVVMLLLLIFSLRFSIGWITFANLLLLIQTSC